MIAVVIIFIVTYLLIASEKIDKTVVALLGASAVIFTAENKEHFYHELLLKVDLNVIFLLIGMMVIVGILSLTGIFEWVAVRLAQLAKGNGIIIAVLFLTITAVFSAFLDNVTTIILMAPITILICQILKIPATPLLIMEAIFSNIGGAATLVGDPPNILIASQTGLTFNQFITNLGPVILVVFLVTITIVLAFFRKTFAVNEVLRKEIMRAEPNRAIVEPKILKRALSVFTLVLAGFFLSHQFHIDPGVIALTGALIMILVTGVDLHEMLKTVEWNAILFFVGLFMLIGALEVVGVFELLGDGMIHMTQGNLWFTALAILWFSALFSAVVDNIPLVIAMIPLIKIMIPTFSVQMGLVGQEELIQTQIAEPLYWSLALGACLGGNGSLIGASANVIVAQVARKNSYKLTFLEFTKYGFPIMILTLLISTVYIKLRYFN